MTSRQGSFILDLADPSATLDRVGGKGASLAKLASAGLPVPSGFHVTTDAYRRFAEQPAEIEMAIRAAYKELGGGRVAVRSSATAEDLPDMSFAGQHDTFLNVRGADAVIDAVKRCWASLFNARAIEYRARRNVTEAPAIAVVVQSLVDATAAGVLFTADPVTHAADRIVINASWGLGDAVVAGHVTPDVIVIDETASTIVEERIADKTVMTVMTDAGTTDAPVSEERRRIRSLDHRRAFDLARLGTRIEALYGRPMDIEWAISNDGIFILQARPITVGAPQSEEWNDSLQGDCLWSSGNLGEAIPDVMTPCTWSLIQRFMPETMPTSSVAGLRAYGNIGGRFYMNLSVAATLAAAFGMKKKFVEASSEVFGKIPAGVDLPTVPISRLRIFRQLVPVIFTFLRRAAKARKEFPAFAASSAGRADTIRVSVGAAASPAKLIERWRDDVEPFFRECCTMLAAVTREGGDSLVAVRGQLTELVGHADADALLTGLHGDAGQLASLGPLIGLSQLARGEIDRETFGRQHGHRSAHEFEISIPRPAEDPHWIDAQLEGLRNAEVDVDTLLKRRSAARKAAWDKLEQTHPRKVSSMRGRIEQWAHIARNRELARSEMIRAFWVVRAFALRAGELLGKERDVFFLTLDEILECLAGDTSSLTRVPARRATYQRYSALPTYPTLIRGPFDPIRWAADPNRRSDVYQAESAPVPVGDTIVGFPGAEGIVEGVARVIARADDGSELRQGEILVTTVTNIGWTPLFPRASAVVTDVGAPLSHAAIVARELGIPAVVGCGNATMRLRTGDRVRVDGKRGVVERLEPATPAPIRP
ncbi:MAG: pyruvate, phosphate dikinase [Polyangiaceae bacterium]|nr:pyruvate, phosphate dikinase [Polyangiaceae bacterium]